MLTSFGMRCLRRLGRLQEPSWMNQKVLDREMRNLGGGMKAFKTS